MNKYIYPAPMVILDSSGNYKLQRTLKGNKYKRPLTYLQLKYQVGALGSLEEKIDFLYPKLLDITKGEYAYLHIAQNPETRKAYTIINNWASDRIIINLGGYEASAVFLGNDISSIYVPHEIRGQGIATEIFEIYNRYIEKENQPLTIMEYKDTLENNLSFWDKIRESFPEREFIMDTSSHKDTNFEKPEMGLPDELM